MHIKFLAHGTGDPNRAKIYLLQSLDYNGVPRPEVRVLRGNPQQVADVAEGLEFAHRYTSAVINWHPTDMPSPQDIEAVLDDFERAAFSGMEPDQYAYAAISHGGHVHIFAARVELRTGLSHNMAPPRRKEVFEHLRNYWNFKKGWARPDDPKRARAVQPTPTFKSDLSKTLAFEADELPKAFGAEPELSSITERHAAVVSWIREKVLDGTINSREKVLEALATIGTLNRTSDDYVSVRFDDSEKPIRFKGTLFSTAFDAVALRKNFSAFAPAPEFERDEPDLVRAAAKKIAFENAVMARSRYNQGRYKTALPSPLSFVEPINAAPDVGLVRRSKHLPQENASDRAGNPFIEEALRIVSISRAAIRSFARTCQIAVESSGRIERASETLKRATERFISISTELKKRKTQSQTISDHASNVRPPGW